MFFPFVFSVATEFPSPSPRPTGKGLGEEKFRSDQFSANFHVDLFRLGILAHTMEVQADRIARTHEGESGVYARALARIYENNLVPAVFEQKHTHPHLYDRLVSAGVRPEYPRPEPADHRSFLRYFLWLLIFILVAKNFFDLW